MDSYINLRPIQKIGYVACFVNGVLLLGMTGITIRITLLTMITAAFDSGYYQRCRIIIGLTSLVGISCGLGAWGIRTNNNKLYFFYLMSNMALIIGFVAEEYMHVSFWPTNEDRAYLNYMMGLYLQDDEITVAWDSIHLEYSCCGVGYPNVSGFHMWKHVNKAYNRSYKLPPTCCKIVSGVCKYNQRETIFIDDCKDAMHMRFYFLFNNLMLLFVVESTLSLPTFILMFIMNMFSKDDVEDVDAVREALDAMPTNKYRKRSSSVSRGSSSPNSKRATLSSDPESYSPSSGASRAHSTAKSSPRSKNRQSIRHEHR